MSPLFLEVAGIGFELAGLSESQRRAVRSHWPTLVRETAEDPIRIEVRKAEPSRPIVPRRGSYELELELEHGDGFTGVASEDLEGRLTWRDGEAISGTLWTPREEPEYFRGILENFVRVAVAHRLVRYGGLLAHGAVVYDGDEALLFVGRSGAGKSTISRLALDAGLRIASDDLNPVAPHGSGTAFVAGGSPFIGEVGSPSERPRPLRGIYRLEKADRDALRPLGAAETVASLFACAPFVNRSPHLRDDLLTNIARIAKSVPGHVLAFRREGSFWPLVKVA